MINFKPLSDTVIVEMDKQSEITRAGIIIPHQKVEAPITGIVIAVGEGRKLPSGNRNKVDCKAGDKVLFGKFAGSEINLNDKSYYILMEADIMAVISEEDSNA